MRELLLAAHKLELKVGEQHVIELEGLGSAGYVWTFQLDDNASIVSIVKQTAAPRPLPPFPEAFSELERFRVIARAPGLVVVTFVHRRPWEDNNIPPRAEMVYEILVKI